jgi:hypothetical protein
MLVKFTEEENVTWPHIHSVKKKITADTGGQQVVRIKLQQRPHQVVRIKLHQIPEVNRLLGVVVVDPVLG